MTVMRRSIFRSPYSLVTFSIEFSVIQVRICDAKTGTSIPETAMTQHFPFPSFFLPSPFPPLTSLPLLSLHLSPPLLFLLILPYLRSRPLKSS